MLILIPTGTFLVPTQMHLRRSPFGKFSRAPKDTSILRTYSHTDDSARLNGGPGCSSFIGLVQENGPFTWFPSAYRPVYNIFSWSQLSNVLYVDQPAGTGFSVGKPGVNTEEETAQQFLGFYHN